MKYALLILVDYEKKLASIEKTDICIKAFDRLATDKGSPEYWNDTVRLYAFPQDLICFSRHITNAQTHGIAVKVLFSQEMPTFFDVPINKIENIPVELMAEVDKFVDDTGDKMA